MKRVLTGLILLAILTVKVNVFKPSGTVGNHNCYRAKNGMHLVTDRNDSKIITVGLRINPLNTEEDIILYEG